jgi:type I restriction enzyme, S subunit
MIDDLPEGWVPATLGDICSKPQYGWTCRASRTGTIKYVRTTDISNGGIDWERVPYCEANPDDVEKYRVMPNDILVSRAGSVGVSFRVTDVPCNAVFASYLIRFKPLDGILPRYIELFLKSDAYWRAISEFSAGIALPNVNASKLASLELPLAPIAEQPRMVARLLELIEPVETCCKRLANVATMLMRFRQSVLTAACSGRLTADWRETHPDCETVDAMLDRIRRRRQGEAATAAQKGRVREVFSALEENDSTELPNGWRYVILRKLCSSFDYGTAAKSQPSGKIPVLRMGNIQNGEIDWSDLVYTSEREEIDNYSLQPNTVLFNRTNSPELVGKTAIYRGKRPAIFAGYLIRINPTPELDPEYLSYCLNTNYAREFCARVKTDGVSQSNINAQKLGAFEVPFCAPAEQQEIVRRVKGLFALADHIESRLVTAQTTLERLVPSLLAKAFRGELVPTEASLAQQQGRDYEPASALLERLHPRTMTKSNEAVRSGRPRRRIKSAEMRVQPRHRRVGRVRRDART